MKLKGKFRQTNAMLQRLLLVRFHLLVLVLIAVALTALPVRGQGMDRPASSRRSLHKPGSAADLAGRFGKASREALNKIVRLIENPPSDLSSAQASLLFYVSEAKAALAEMASYRYKPGANAIAGCDKACWQGHIRRNQQAWEGINKWALEMLKIQIDINKKLAILKKAIADVPSKRAALIAELTAIRERIAASPQQGGQAVDQGEVDRTFSFVRTVAGNLFAVSKGIIAAHKALLDDKSYDPEAFHRRLRHSREIWVTQVKPNKMSFTFTDSQIGSPMGISGQPLDQILMRVNDKVRRDKIAAYVKTLSKYFGIKKLPDIASFMEANVAVLSQRWARTNDPKYRAALDKYSILSRHIAAGARSLKVKARAMPSNQWGVNWILF